MTLKRSVLLSIRMFIVSYSITMDMFLRVLKIEVLTLEKRSLRSVSWLELSLKSCMSLYHETILSYSIYNFL